MNMILKFSQLNGWAADLFKGIGNLFTNMVSAILGWIFVMFYYVIITPLFSAMDAVQALFRKFAGLSDYIIDGETKSGDIILTLINSETVQNVFWSLVILAVVLLIITTIVALIRAQTQTADDKDRKTNNQIFVTAVKALVNFFMVPVVAILGIFMGNALLKSLDQATSGQNNIRMSSLVFTSCAYDCNRARKDSQFAQDIASGKNAFGVLTGDKDSIADKIDEAFKNNSTFTKSTFQRVDENGREGNMFADPDGTYGFFRTISLGSLETFYSTERSSFNIYDVYQVWYYYDLTSFNFLFALIACFFISWVLLSTSVGLVKRMFKVTILLCISPMVASTMPLDNGKALKSWREGFIGSVLSAYSTVVVLNLTFQLLGPINNIDFFAGNIFYSAYNQVAHLIIICASMFFFKDLTGELAKMFGMENAYVDGDKATQDLGAKVAKGAGIATAGVSGLRAAKMARKAHRAGDEKAAEQYRDKAKAKLSMARDRFAGLATNGVSDKIMGEHDALDKRYSYRKSDKAVSTLKKDGTQQAIKEKYNKNTGITGRILDTTVGAMLKGTVKTIASPFVGLGTTGKNIVDSVEGMVNSADRFFNPAKVAAEKASEISRGQSNIKEKKENDNKNTPDSSAPTTPSNNADTKLNENVNTNIKEKTSKDNNNGQPDRTKVNNDGSVTGVDGRNYRTRKKKTSNSNVNNKTTTKNTDKKSKSNKKNK